MDSYLGVLNLIPDSPSHLGFFETAALPPFLLWLCDSQQSQSVRVNKYPSPFHRLPSFHCQRREQGEREPNSSHGLCYCVRSRAGRDSQRQYSLNRASP